MPLFLVTSVCDEGVYPTSFRVVEADSREAVAADMLAHPHKWERFLRNSSVWWDLTYYEYKYKQPRGWSPAEFLAALDRTHVDGDSSDQVRIHPITDITQIPDRPAENERTDAPVVVCGERG